MSRQWVFGYASLVADHAGGGSVLTELPGYRRRFGVATDNERSIPGYKMYLSRAGGSRPAVAVAFLDLVADPDCAVEGLTHPVDDTELAALDLRERNYDRIDISDRIAGVEGRVWTYIGSDEGRGRCAAGRAAGRAVVSRDYLDKVHAGYRALGDDHHDRFLASSDLDDLPVWDLDRVDLSPLAGPAAWHDVECSLYGADLPLWRSLADEYGSPVLDIGAGTGRVALDLAPHGYAVTAIDAEPELVAACAERAAALELPVTAITADARSLDLGTTFPLVILPMQVAQLMGSDEGRRQMLAAVMNHLEPGGVLAVALADPFEGVPAHDVLPPLPDVLEIDGWVLSSTPIAVRAVAGAVAIDRRRQAVSPTGDLIEEPATIVLDDVDPAVLERLGQEAGYRVLAQRSVPATNDYVGSTVVMLERPR